MPLKQTPYWWETLAASASGPPPTELPQRADVAVVGGGYTGLSAARTLAAAGASVVVLEGRTVGWGASSRNGGQVLTGGKLGAPELLRRFGRERARRLHRASLDAIDFVERLVQNEGIDCGFARVGHLDAAAKPSHFASLERQQDTLDREFDHRVSLIPRAAQRAELGSDYYHGALLDEASGCLNPAQYVAGLAAAAARRGARLAEHATVARIERGSGGFRLETSRGTLAAREVLVASNGYTTALTPRLRRRVIPLGSYIIATAPLPEATAAALLPRRRVVFDSKHFLYYFRLSEDRRLLFGGRAQFTPATEGSTRRSAEILRRGLLRVFPELAGVEIEYVWSGNVCFTRDLFPHAGTLDDLRYAMGYCGHGVAMASYLGDVMADVMLGRPDRNPFRDLRFPAIPLYDGRPWFLPAVALWFRLLDWLP